MKSLVPHSRTRRRDAVAVARFVLLARFSFAAVAACARGGGGEAVEAATNRAAETSAAVLASAAPASSATDTLDAASSSVPDAAAVVAEPPAGMLLVPGGAFTMGSDETGQEDERPAHQVTLASFFLDRTEVTNAEWAECVSAGACRAKSDEVRTKHPDFNGPSQPVSGIAWADAKAYCGWRNKRLPREAEFERAVRGAEDRKYPWGGDPPTHERTVFSSARTEDVGTHPLGRGPYGHDDLAGNVWEWMEDEYDPYAYRRPTASEGRPGACPEILAAQDELRREHKQGFTGSNPIPTECEHSIRGGAYNYDAFGLRSTNRVHHPGRYRIPMLGVRCAKDAQRGG